MRETLEGRVAIVTGASSGIGEATAREFASRGASVVLAARNAGKISELEKSLSGAGYRTLAVVTDVSDRDSVDEMVRRTVEAFGTVDILVNNAGLGLSGRIEDLRAGDLRQVFEVNTVGPLNCIQAVLPHMGRGARIINVSSVVGKRSVPKVGGYCATKFALNALTDALRVEVADRGVSVTSVYPGTTRTAFRENSRRTGDEKRGWRPRAVGAEKVAKRIADAAERAPRDAYVTLSDRLYVAVTVLLPGLTDRLLRLWARG